MWMIRAGSGSKNIEEFVEHRIVAVGDPKLGPLSPTITKDELLKLYAERYPEAGEATRASWASQLLRFVTEVKIGDEVTTYDRERRKYLLGKVTSENEWTPKLIEDLPNVRRVNWTHEVPRDQLSTTSRNSLGAIQTLFKLGSDVAKDLHAHAVPIGSSPIKPAPKKSGSPGDKAALANLVEETIEKADEADRADVATTLITLPILRKLLLDHYENLDAETRALVPLRRLYWPVAME